MISRKLCWHKKSSSKQVSTKMIAEIIGRIYMQNAISIKRKKIFPHCLKFLYVL